MLEGPRITSHDVKVQTVDYNLLGDGWFDMDKNIDLAARIVLSPQFSKELIEQKKEVAYIANKDGQIDIPLQIVGQLPKPQVLPNVTELAQLATNSRGPSPGSEVSWENFRQEGPSGRIGKISRRRLRWHGGGSGNGSGSSNGGGNSNPPPNPLDQLKKLF